jgi:hypothetical protein
MIVSIAVLLPFLVSFDTKNLGQRYWYISGQYLPVIIVGLSGTFTGLIASKLTKNKLVKSDEFQSSLSSAAEISIMAGVAKFTFLLASLGYLIWIATDFSGWTNISYYGHLETIPGLTTLTQFMPISLAIYYYLSRTGISLKASKYIIISGIFISMVRAFVNHERLALLECCVPLIVVYFLTEKRIYKIQLSKLYIGSLAAIYSFFSIGEYFRSWYTYRNLVDESFFVFSIFRLINYYSTSINNGVVYLGLHEQISSIPLYTFNFIWNFPLIGPYLYDLFESGRTNLGWSQALKSTMGTNEFNNINSYFQVVAELRKFTAFIVFATIAYSVNKLYQSINSYHSYAIPIYASIVVGIIELPRIFWFGNGRAFPILITCMYLFKKLNSPLKSIQIRV